MFRIDVKDLDRCVTPAFAFDGCIRWSLGRPIEDEECLACLKRAAEVARNLCKSHGVNEEAGVRIEVANIKSHRELANSVSARRHQSELIAIGILEFDVATDVGARNDRLAIAAWRADRK